MFSFFRGLGSLRSRYFLLRDELHFRPSVYYTAVLIDFIARLGWALVISPQQPYLQQHFILLLAAVEISRRCMWAVFRVEWEFVKNWSGRGGGGGGSGPALRSGASGGHQSNPGKSTQHSSGNFYMSPHSASADHSAGLSDSPGASSDKLPGNLIQPNNTYYCLLLFCCASLTNIYAHTTYTTYTGLAEDDTEKLSIEALERVS